MVKMCADHISQKEKEREPEKEREKECERWKLRRKKRGYNKEVTLLINFVYFSNYITDGLIFLTVQLVLIIICAIRYHRLMSSLLLCYYLTPTFPK